MNVARWSWLAYRNTILRRHTSHIISHPAGCEWDRNVVGERGDGRMASMRDSVWKRFPAVTCETRDRACGFLIKHFGGLNLIVGRQFPPRNKSNQRQSSVVWSEDYVIRKFIPIAFAFLKLVGPLPLMTFDKRLNFLDLNGRGWLGRQMQREGIACEEKDNGFTPIRDLVRPQALLDRLVRLPWAQLLNRWA